MKTMMRKMKTAMRRRTPRRRRQTRMRTTAVSTHPQTRAWTPRKREKSGSIWPDRPEQREWQRLARAAMQRTSDRPSVVFLDTSTQVCRSLLCPISSLLVQSLSRWTALKICRVSVTSPVTKCTLKLLIIAKHLDTIWTTPADRTCTTH